MKFVQRRAQCCFFAPGMDGRVEGVIGRGRGALGGWPRHCFVLVGCVVDVLPFIHSNRWATSSRPQLHKIRTKKNIGNVPAKRRPLSCFSCLHLLLPQASQHCSVRHARKAKGRECVRNVCSR